MIVFGRIPKVAESIAEVINVREPVVRQVDNILKRSAKEKKKLLIRFKS
jgi:hypothetical protein